jgi:excisionase family DNA binding protein
MELMTVEEVAAKLRVSTKTIRRWCADGQIKALRVGRQWRVTQDALDKFLAESQEVKEDLKKADGPAAYAARPTIAAALHA